MGVSIAIVIVAVILGLVAWFIRQGGAEYRAEADALNAISEISVAEAEQRALRLLKDENLFRCVDSRSLQRDGLEPLANGLQQLFRRFDSIESVSGPRARLDRQLIDQSMLHPDFTRIGRGMEGSDVEFEIGVLAGKETVYELHPEEPPDPVFGTHKTVFHWVLATAAEMKAHDADADRASVP
jgi:hypothetical protein